MWHISKNTTQNLYFQTIWFNTSLIPDQESSVLPPKKWSFNLHLKSSRERVPICSPSSPKIAFGELY